MNWSGGKDAAYGLHLLRQATDVKIHYLLTTLSREHRRISMHGVREELLLRQAQAMGIPLRTLYLPENTTLDSYQDLMAGQLSAFLAEDIRYAAFGDIFLEDLKKYREEQIGRAGMQCIFPLWKKDTSALLQDFWAAGFKAIITCVNARLLDWRFAGRLLDEKCIRDLPEGVDPCGENGEYHTFVFDGPLFKKPVSFSKGKIVERTYQGSTSDDKQWDNRFFFCDLLP